ncbi:MAG TPA: pitrilysin family protein [Bryobacteraceae bacterium]|jgi:zinc protease
MQVRLLLLLSAAALLMAADAPNKVFPYAYNQEDLPNGLRIVTIPTDFPNIVSVYIVVQTGSRNEVEPGKTGFAHLFEHIMFRGTEKYPPEKYNEILSRAGAASNASTSDDLTVYHTTFSKEDLPTILDMEADRFQNLKYSLDAFKTETGAVLGEYNKNSANPDSKMEEVLHDTAFDRHTYKHTTMGFLKDVQDMPQQFDYSLKFFDRYYRPEYTTIIVTGDVDAKQVRALVDKSWGNWKRGSYHADIPVEPKQTAARENHVDWPSPTLPQIAVAFKGPAYSDTTKDTVALDVLSTLAFGSTSDLYQKLVVKEQKVDGLGAYSPFSVDPNLFDIRARLKNPADMQYVRDEILKTVKQFQTTLVPADKLAAVVSRERYGFALRLDNSESVSSTVSTFVALRRTPGTIDKLYALYGQLTSEDIRAAAQKYLIDSNRTIVTLTGAEK